MSSRSRQSINPNFAQNVDYPATASQLEDAYDRQQSERNQQTQAQNNYLGVNTNNAQYNAGTPTPYNNISNSNEQMSYLQQQHMIQENLMRQQQNQLQVTNNINTSNIASANTSQAVSPQPVQRVTIQQAGGTTTRPMLNTRNANRNIFRNA
jgi:hypothetical protein